MSETATADISSLAEASTNHLPSAQRRQTWAVGGGKGGIGKSFITSSIGIALARAGKRIVIIDLDLGGANLHTCLGAEVPNKTLTDFVVGRVPHLQDLVAPSPIPNLFFISGANDTLNAANLPNDYASRILGEVNKINADYILFDLGAGTHANTLDFFLAADKSIIAVVPEPTSMENAYRFIKSAFYRRMKQLEEELVLKSIVEEAMDQKNQKGIRTPSDLVRYIAQTSPQSGMALANAIQSMRLYLIMNQVRTKSDVEAGHSMKSVCRKYFGIETEYVGYLDYDNAVWQAIRKRRPMVLEYPYSSLVNGIAVITRYLVDPGQYRTMV